MRGSKDCVRLARFILLLFVAVIALPVPAAAQSGSVSGVVKDPQQAVVPGAEVVLRKFAVGRDADTEAALAATYGVEVAVFSPPSEARSRLRVCSAWLTDRD